MSFDRYIHPCNQHKNQDISHFLMPFAATWMDIEIITLSEVDQTERQTPYITYMWNLKYD